MGNDVTLRITSLTIQDVRELAELISRNGQFQLNGKKIGFEQLCRVLAWLSGIGPKLKREAEVDTVQVGNDGLVYRCRVWFPQWKIPNNLKESFGIGAS